MEHLLERNNLILMEAAIVEQIRRSGDVELHPQLVIAPLIYEEPGRTALARFTKATSISLVKRRCLYWSARQHGGQTMPESSPRASASPLTLTLRNSWYSCVSHRRTQP